ncbi:MAG: homocysteine S-methyltransferase family protein [Candidatus Omnitrophica bacterium]|nr:homocysteine S-methyltransferase family protein [Candidatus Omnitrophota bacterium]MDD5429502.1 homocysteine S-methyltransferase family protein [Candidatus Omnitrophota bacterium]
MKKRIHNLINKGVVILDGATGTELQKKGLPQGACPEKWCLENPAVISTIHSEYARAGADIIYTCTFGANRPKLAQYGLSDVFRINKCLGALAKKSAGTKSLVAGGIGPTGEFVSPFGALGFEEAVDIFKEQIKGLIAGGVDLLVIETMMDIQEARAALLAIKESGNLFSMVSMTYEKHSRTLNGNDPVSSLITLQNLGADVVGCNCSTGPKEMIKVISLMRPYAKVPLLAKPNAGLPRFVNNSTVFNMGPKRFAEFGKKLVSAGAGLVGGCCGSGPEHIHCLRKTVAGSRPVKLRKRNFFALSCARDFFILDDKNTFAVVGEKINPSGKKKMQQELIEGNFSIVREYARKQASDGAKLLDVNVGCPGTDEKKLMLKAIGILSVSSNLPLVIDSSDPEVLEAALRFYPGRALINSISGEKKKVRKLLPLAKKYGAMFILLPLSGKKLPLRFAERKKNINNIYALAKKEGFDKSDIVVDVLAMAVSCHYFAAEEALKTIRWCAKVFKTATIIGLSNTSFGLPQRHLINRVFLTLARKTGLCLAIADPLDLKPCKDKFVVNFLLNKPGAGSKFIAKYSGFPAEGKISKVSQSSSQENLRRAILEGNKEGAAIFVKAAMVSGSQALRLMREVMVPALVEVGELFEKKRYFLPQLIASAEAMKSGVKVLQPFLKSREIEKDRKGIVLMATVEGDIHDIGKNIVSLMLKNHGFQIIDLGKDVSTVKIIQAIKRHTPDIVALSALMTTTMVNMGEVVEEANKEGLRCGFMVGGAVVTEAYAASIGASYAKDGVHAVEIAKKLQKK